MIADACEAPGCESTENLFSLNGTTACGNHIDWAVKRVLRPVKKARRAIEEAMKEDE